LKVLPELEFEQDRSVETVDRIERLLHDLHREDA
jgi:ribosome-binding factor A